MVVIFLGYIVLSKGVSLMQKIIIFGILAVVVTVAGVVFLSFNGKPKTVLPPTTTVPQQPTAATPVSSVPTSAREISIEGNEYNFSPSSIDLKTGETVKVTFKNTGKLPHNLTIAELGVATKTVGGGREDTITITASTAGSYKFFCSVGNHRQLGMEGTLQAK